jgi:hypothetical protein
MRIIADVHANSGAPAALARADLISALADVLRKPCADLEERLRWCNQHLRERTQKLYDLQRPYSTSFIQDRE